MFTFDGIIVIYDETQPLVSIILTVYNRQDFLNRCIGSILDQSYKNWELIAIDDGSSDESHLVLNRYAVQFKNIKVIKQKNQKPPLSRNNGIAKSSGRYLAFIDSDDEYEKDHLLKRVEFMETNDSVDFIHGGIKIIGNEFVRDKNDPEKLIHLSDCSICGTFFGKREVFTELKGFKNIAYSEDSDFLERAEKKFAVRKVFFDTYIYHRDVKDSITNNYEPE